MEADDPSIKDSWRLLRRVPIDIDGICPHLVWSENENAWVPTSAAFHGHPDNRRAFSVHLEPVLIEQGLAIDSVIQDRSKYALAALTAGQVRALKQIVARNPLPGDPAHAHVIGDKTPAVRKNLRKCAVWVIAPALPPPALA